MSATSDGTITVRGERDSGAWRLVFASAAVINLSVGILLIFAERWLKPFLSLDPIEGTNKVTLYLTSGLVMLFGVVYARFAIRTGPSREMLTLSVFGKIIGAVSVMLAILEGAASLRLLPLALIDLAYAGTFTAYLARGFKGFGRWT